MAQMSTQIPHVLDNPGELWREYEVISNPTMLFISADGTVERQTGGLGPQGLLDRVKDLET